LLAPGGLASARGQTASCTKPSRCRRDQPGRPRHRGSRKWCVLWLRGGLAVLVAGCGAAPEAIGGSLAAASGVKSGTAFFVSPDGLLVTSGHVVAGCPDIDIWPSSGPMWRGRVVAADASVDIALLSAEGHVLRSAVSDRRDGTPRPGDPVSTIGFGVRASRPRAPLVTNGRLIGRAADPTGNPFLLIQAGLSEGNSGGPVIDANGTLLGMVAGRDTGRPELGVAIPAEAIDRFLGGLGISRIPSIPSGSQPTNTADLLKAMAVLVQCVPVRRITWAASQRFKELGVSTRA
jgi:S1-C subfamily serine protease